MELLKSGTFLSLILLGAISFSLQTCVKDLSVLKSKLRNARPGDVICIANGEYKNWMIQIKRNGIKLTGEEGGKVVLKGQSQVRIFSSNVKVANLYFTAPLNESGNSRNFASPLEFDRLAKNSEIYDCAIINHAANNWVRVRGNQNNLHHCIFKDKPAPVIGIPSKIVFVGHKTMYGNTVHHNRFENYDPDALIRKHKHDGAEAIFVKVSRNDGRETKNFGIKVHHNYFYKIDAEQETIGIKSSGNEVFENAIEECFGGISLRHGKRNEVKRNYIRMRNVNDRDNFGINVHDSDHIVEGNWITNAGRNNGIGLTGSNGVATCNACHVRAKNISIINNVLVNSALKIGRQYEGSYYQSPENIKIQGLVSSCAYDFPMIAGTEVCKAKSFLGEPTTFFGHNHFSGSALTVCKSLDNLQKLLHDSKKIIWTTSPADLGDKGDRMIRKIKHASGPSWYKNG